MAEDERARDPMAVEARLDRLEEQAASTRRATGQGYGTLAGAVGRAGADLQLLGWRVAADRREALNDQIELRRLPESLMARVQALAERAGLGKQAEGAEGSHRHAGDCNPTVLRVSPCAPIIARSVRTRYNGRAAVVISTAATAWRSRAQ